ncbi:mitofusin [Ascosphaera aggregata]|nr:mitofusin [Ascosphaera aggregata]
MDHQFSSSNGFGAGEGSSKRPPQDNPDFARSAYHDISPDYLVQGNGYVSENATSLMASLNRDSGYGDSIGSHTDVGYNGWMEDRPTLARLQADSTTVLNLKLTFRANDMRLLSKFSNQNRLKLSRTITKTIELLRDLCKTNRQHPAYYPAPSVNAASAVNNTPPTPATDIPRAQTLEFNDVGSAASHRQQISPLRRSRTSFNQSASSKERPLSGESVGTPAPRLVTPQIAHELSILKVDLRVGSFSTADLASLEKASIASLLESRVNQSIKHLFALRDRIEDTSSKVLITGDLNAGKSTFCNALLRRKILPEDQQPCTSIFCEVLDARENGGIEEVHAIHKDAIYDRHDESTYDVYTLADLEELVIDNTTYLQCKVYVKDIRKIDESLLNNGVVDISIIDAPGLNSDSVKTTAVFARQEEIDVVVFVVSAANHFTLSAQEFIQNAAHEKTYMFIVVNGYDNIRDKKRCQQMILKQVANLSPRTYKESDELVHFVSSNSIPVALPQPVPSPGGNGSGSGSRGDNGDNGPENGNDEPNEGEDGGKGKGKKNDDDKGIRDFGNLEASLRRFVLEKRSHSKLAPARTYLMNVLSDLFVLASANKEVASREYQAAKRELDTLIPEYDNNNKSQKKVHEEVETKIDDTCEDVFDHTRRMLDGTIANLHEISREIEYLGFFSVFQYAEDLKFAMLDRVQEAVVKCEDYGRHASVQGVNLIKSLGLLHVGAEKFGSFEFHADLMYRKNKHRLARQVDAEIDAWDFFNFAAIWQKQEKLVSAGAAISAVGVFGGKSLASMGLLDGVVNTVELLSKRNMRRLAIPSIIVAAGMAVFYILSEIPNSLPTNIQRKISALLYELDYTHANATRISNEVRRVLRMPAKQLQTTLQAKTEELGRRKDKITMEKQQSEVALKYFSNLFREAGENRRAVESINLEAPLAGSMAEYA